MSGKSIAVLLCALLAACTFERIERVDSIPADSIVARLGPQACGWAPGVAVTDEGLGALTIGAPFSTVRERCRILGDSVDPGVADSVGSRDIRVDLVRDTAAVRFVRDSIVRIEIHHSPFRTADSLYVGGHLTRILRLRDPVGETIGRTLYARSPEHCGLLFELLTPAPAPPATQSGLAALNRLPGETRIRRIVIVGCGSQR